MHGGACPRLPEHVWIGDVPFTWPGMCGVPLYLNMHVEVEVHVYPLPDQPEQSGGTPVEMTCFNRYKCDGSGSLIILPGDGHPLYLNT